MAYHFDRITQFRLKRQDENFDVANETSQKLILKYVIKLSDIGHGLKDWDLHYRWSLLVQSEFFAQGDLERAQRCRLPGSEERTARRAAVVLDRTKVDIPSILIEVL